MLCTDLHVDGLMGILINETLPDVIGADGVAVPAERITFPRSEAIPDGLTALQTSRAIHIATKQDRDALGYAIEHGIYKGELITAAGDVVCNELMHPVYGLARVTCAHITHHARTRFATPYEGDIYKLNCELHVWCKGETFTKALVRWNAIHLKLENMGQGKSEYDKEE